MARADVARHLRLLCPLLPPSRAACPPRFPCIQTDTTPFFEAAKGGHMKIMEALVARGVDVNAKAQASAALPGSPCISTATPQCSLPQHRCAPLVPCVRHARFAVFVSVSSPPQNDITALMEASHKGDLKAVKFLIQHGAEVGDAALDVSRSVL